MMNIDDKGPVGPVGAAGPIGACPRCGSINISCNLKADTNLCKDCGWPGHERRKINVLGAEYTITKVHDDPRMDGSDGFCDETTKEIVVETYEGDDGKPGVKAHLDIQRKKNVRHELIHAFLFECGLAENSPWAQNEELVDWIAIQGPKIYMAWQEAGAI